MNAEINIKNKRLGYMLIVLSVILYTVLIARAAQAKEAKVYAEWRERYVTDYLAQQEALKAGMPVDPYTAQLDYEAGILAKVLYGVRDNSERDLRTYCWCVFNRVDNPAYPDMIEDVIAQPKQWMRYDPENPVLDNLYKIARQELDAWHTGTTRPVSIDYVYMTWTPSKITLRNAWKDNGFADYWRAE